MLTLLSDFGLNDASVAIAKGILMQHTPMPIVDITHDITPYHIRQAAYLLSGAYKSFPPGTCHVLLFDLFSGPNPRLALYEHNNHYFLTPDNGLLPLTLGGESHQAKLCFELKKENTFTDWLHAAGKVISSLQTEKPESLNLPAIQLKTLPQKTTPSDESNLPSGEAGTIQCEVIHIDHYENVVINITRPQFESYTKGLPAALIGSPFRLVFMDTEEIEEISGSYHDVREGYKLCRFNSNGHLEICINHGKAASLFGLRLDGKHNNIKIVFQ